MLLHVILRISLDSIDGLHTDYSAPSCDHFGRHGELKKYLATKILAKVANWRPTDLKRNLLENLSKIRGEFNQ